jgi:hypothetical protein
MNQNVFTAYLPYISIMIGLIMIGISMLLDSKKSKLKDTGIATDGIIFKQELSNSIDKVSDTIIVRFVTQKQEWITGIIQQDFQLFYTGQFKNGEAIMVYYGQDNPSNFYVDTKQSELLGRVFIGIIGFLFIMVGLYKFFINHSL